MHFFMCLFYIFFVHSTCFERLFRSSSVVHKLLYLQLCTNHAKGLMVLHGLYRAADTVTYGLLMMNEIIVRNM